MTFKTFEELDAEAGPASLFMDRTAKAEASPKGFKTVEQEAKNQEIASRSVFAAAFRQDNTIVSMMSRKDAGIDNYDDGKFNHAEFMKANPELAGYDDNFLGVLNEARANGIKAQILAEKKDKETLDASGWAGTFAQIVAGVVDAPTLIPGSVAVKTAAGGYAIRKSMLLAGASAAATQAATEGALQSQQQTRRAGESLVNIGAAAVIGSLIGGSLAAAMSKNDQITMRRALDELSDINAGNKPNTIKPLLTDTDNVAQGLGADATPGFYVDPLTKPRTSEELAVDGVLARTAVKLTSWMNPVLRGTQRYIPEAQQLMAKLYEDTIYRVMHSQGETTGAAVETMFRSRVVGSQVDALKQSELAYKEMIGTNIKLSTDDFYAEVGKAMRNKDSSDNPFVARAAQAYRKMFDEWIREAVKLGLLDADKLDVKTAVSFFSRHYNRDALLAAEPQFLEEIGTYYARQMQGEYKEARLAYDADRAKYAQRRDDLAQTGEARAARIQSLEDSAAKLDAEHAHLSDLIDEIGHETRTALNSTGEERAAARARVKELRAQGGDELANYKKQQAELRRRKEDLTVRNPDAMAARGEAIAERVSQLEEEVSKSLTTFGKRAKKLLSDIESDPVSRAEEAVLQTEKLARQAEQQLIKASERASKLAEGDPASAATLMSTAERRMADVLDKLNAKDAGVDVARGVLKDIELLLKDVTDATAQRVLKKAERLQQLKKRAAALSPEELKAKAGRQNQRIDDAEARRDDAFYQRWEVARAKDLETGEALEFLAHGKEVAKDVYDKLTGKVAQREEDPTFKLTVTTRGPMKDRSFLVPDELLTKNNWLIDDVREVGHRYARAMAGEIELTRAFGRADMKDQLANVAKKYSEQRVAVQNAQSIEELNGALGRDKYSKRKDLEAAKLDAQKVLSADESSVITDLKAGRDMIRGVYKVDANNTNFASITRSVMHFNYMRSMGGAALASAGEFYRPAMVHGLGLYMKVAPELLPQAIGQGSEAVKLSLREAHLAGIGQERAMHALMAAHGEVADPFLSSVSKIERFMQKGTAIASRWNFLNVITDAQQSIGGVMSQHRILEAALGNGGKDGSFVVGKGKRLLRFLNIGQQAQEDIAKLFALHGETVDGIKVANTERWAEVLPDGLTAERAEAAVRAYRAAVNKDVNSIVSKRGMGDAPLLANTPWGRLWLQFTGYGLGAHSRVMIRGLQEDQGRFVGGLVAMSTIGISTAYLASVRSGAESHEKRMSDWRKDPAMMVGEGLDRSGLFPVLFEVSNRVEKASTSLGYNYRFNPVKSSIVKAAGGSFFADTPSTRSSEGAGILSAVGGPSVGLLESVPAAGRVALARAEGRDPTKRDVNQSLAVVPFNTYVGMKEVLQVINGNSVYTRP